MAYIPNEFTPTSNATVQSTDLISQVDEKLQTLTEEVGAYLQEEIQSAYDDDLNPRMEAIEDEWDSLELQVNSKMDDLLSVNPDGTYYTKSAIDTSLDTKVDKVTSTDNAIVRFNGTSGQVQNSSVIVDDSGNVGVGGIPATQLEVTIADGASTQGIRIKNLDTSMGAGQTVGALEVYSSDPSGAGVGVKGAIRVKSYDIAGSAYDMIFTTSNATTNDIERMRIDSAGNVNVGGESQSGNKYIQVLSGTLSDGQSSSVYATGGINATANRSSRLLVYKHSGIVNACGANALTTQDGVVNYLWCDDSDQLRISTIATHIGTTSGTVVGTQTSDERVKNIVGACPYGLSEILELETIKYSMKDDVEGTYKLGFSAQQAMGVIPESVYDTNERLKEPVTTTKTKVVQEAKEAELDDEGNVLVPAIEEITEKYEDIEYQDTDDEVTKLAMDYQMMIPVLVNAIKELKAEIELLKGDK